MPDTKPGSAGVAVIERRDRDKSDYQGGCFAQMSLRRDERGNYYIQANRIHPDGSYGDTHYVDCEDPTRVDLYAQEAMREVLRPRPKPKTSGPVTISITADGKEIARRVVDQAPQPGDTITVEAKPILDAISTLLANRPSGTTPSIQGREPLQNG